MTEQTASRRHWTFAALTVAAAPLAAWSPLARAQPRDAGDYTILQARYGTANRNIDVTRRLQELAGGDQVFLISNTAFGSDPAPGRTKTLRIIARAPNGETRSFDYREGDTVDGQQFAGWRDGRWGQSGYRGGWGGGERGRGEPGRGDGGEFRILQALYGTPRRNVDVTQRLRELASSDRDFRLKNETFGVDPDEGRVKTLRIYARGAGGQERMFEYREGSVVDGSRFAGWGRGDWGDGNRRGGGWGR